MISNTKDTIKRLSEILVKMKSSGFSEIMPDLIVEFVDCVDNHVGDDDIILLYLFEPPGKKSIFKEEPFRTNKESAKLLENDLFRDSIENLLMKCSNTVFENNIAQESIAYIIKFIDRESSLLQTCLERSTPGGCFMALNMIEHQDAIRIASLERNYKLLENKIGGEVFLEIICNYIYEGNFNMDILNNIRSRLIEPVIHNEMTNGDVLVNYYAQIICNNRDTKLHDMVYERLKYKRATIERLSIPIMRDMFERGDFEKWSKYIHKNSSRVLEMCTTGEAKDFISYSESKKWSLKVHLNRYFEYLAGQTTIGDHEKYKHGGYLNIVLNTRLAYSATKVLPHIGIEKIAEWWPNLSDDSFNQLMLSFPECPQEHMIELFPKSKRAIISHDLGI